jgi:hypothetical protein
MKTEEIEKAAMQVAGVHPDWSNLDCFRMGFREGAKFADKTMLDRACEWLRFRVSVDVPIETNENGEPLADSWIKAQMERAKAAEELIAEFRQAMKGGVE